MVLCGRLSCKTKYSPKTTWRNYIESEGLAGGDFYATRLPIRITDYYLVAKVVNVKHPKDLLRSEGFIKFVD